MPADRSLSATRPVSGARFSRPLSRDFAAAQVEQPELLGRLQVDEAGVADARVEQRQVGELRAACRQSRARRR